MGREEEGREEERWIDGAFGCGCGGAAGDKADKCATLLLLFLSAGCDAMQLYSRAEALDAGRPPPSPACFRLGSPFQAFSINPSSPSPSLPLSLSLCAKEKAVGFLLPSLPPLAVAGAVGRRPAAGAKGRRQLAFCFRRRRNTVEKRERERERERAVGRKM